MPTSAKKVSSEAEALLYLAQHPEEFPKYAFESGPDGKPVQLEEWQVEALTQLTKSDRIAIRSGHGVGKSAYLAIVILWFILTRYPCKIPCTANSQSQLFDILWSELGVWWRCLKPEFRNMIEIKGDRVELIADRKNSFAVARTARREQPEALQGFHSSNLLFIIDEGSGVPDDVFEVAKGSMSTPGAITVMTGNPTRVSGFFHRAFTKMKHRWWTRKVPCAESSRVTKEYPKEIAEEYGVDSNVYRVRVLGEFPETDDDTVIARSLLEAATERDISATGVEVWGVDVARYGDDESALAKRRGQRIMEPIKTWRNKDSTQLAALIAGEYALAKVKPAEICVDVIGVGSGVYDQLIHEHDLPAKAVNVAERPATADQKFERLRDELWFKMKDWFTERGCQIPPQEELIEELSAPRYRFLASGRFKVESKDEMKSRGIKSPDKAEAVLMTFASNIKHNSSRSGWNTKGPLQVSSGGLY